MKVLDIMLAVVPLALSALLSWTNRDGTWAYMMAAFTGLLSLAYSVGAGLDPEAWLGWATAVALIAVGFVLPRLRRPIS